MSCHQPSTSRPHPGRRFAALTVGMALALTLCLPATPAFAVLAPPNVTASSPALAGKVLKHPSPGTPQLAPTGTTEQIKQLVQCGGTMYAVGTFTAISQDGVTVTRDNVFSFGASSPYAITSWNPDVNGTVYTITFNDGNCADAYIGGKFTSVGATVAKNIAEVDTTTGAVVSTFRHSASSVVESLLAVNGHLLTGGRFKNINSSHNAASYYFASLSPATGMNDHFLALHISGEYQFPGAHWNRTEITRQELSNDGTRDLVEGDFTSVGGKPRQQIFMLDLTRPHARVTGWSSPEWDASSGVTPECGDSHPEYIADAAWSPDDKIIYIADTGFRPYDWSGVFPLSGLCDAVAAFPATPVEVLHRWVNYSGCNSFFSVAADSRVIYAAGHERWGDNAFGCKSAGPGAVTTTGMTGFKLSGSVLLNTRGTGYYKRGRGLGADTMLLTPAGLWIGSDNLNGTNDCGGQSGYAGICFLPYRASGPPPTTPPGALTGRRR